VKRSERARIAILKALHEMAEPSGAAKIARRLRGMGVDLQPRTIRLYLYELDDAGLTELVSKRRGRVITSRGIDELAHANVAEKLGFIAARVDSLSYRMSLDMRCCSGSVITNVAWIDQRGLGMALKEIRSVFAAGLGMGTRMALVAGGGHLAGMDVPLGSVAIGAVCSVTLNGLLIDAGIPVTSRFGGLVEIENGEPVRFVELIEYQGTTLDPLEAFIKAEMTKVRQCAATGSGIIGASFREIPAEALDEVTRIRGAMHKQGLDGILSVGRPGTALLGVPVAEGRAGIVVTGGLNPVAAVHEAGIRLTMLSLAGLENVDRFLDYNEINE